jgi:acyl-CoA synthetase (AMP-forming)/AMP-acid ligase II
MVGYLNAPSPFDADGWLCTGDRVEVRGEFMRVLGRESDIINVGGQKVFPSEVENVLLDDRNVAEASVFGARHPLLGQVANARLTLHAPEDHDQLVARLRRHCIDRLAKYKVPVRFLVVSGQDQVTERFKKSRQQHSVERT